MNKIEAEDIFRNDSDVYFEPWIGNQYFNATFEGRRVLVVGDSHWCKDNKCSSCGVKGLRDKSEMVAGGCTRWTIDQVLEGCSTYTIFSNLMKINWGKDIWDRISFYNYLQTACAHTHSNTEYPVELYHASFNAFEKVLNVLRPEKVLIWGDRVWNNALPEEFPSDFFYTKYRLGSYAVMCYKDLGDDMEFIGIYHPSWLNKQDLIVKEETKKVIKEFLEY